MAGEAPGVSLTAAAGAGSLTRQTSVLSALQSVSQSQLIGRQWPVGIVVRPAPHPASLRRRCPRPYLRIVPGIYTITAAPPTHGHGPSAPLIPSTRRLRLTHAPAE
jgi:hypothetical protein